MFYYLSFLRPPPVSSPVNEQLVLTPQVANDLRTELYEDELSISYQWLPNGASSSLPQGRQPLTTWYGSGSAYKTLAIDPPKGVKAGETWSLALYSNSGRSTSASPAWKSDFVQVAHLGEDNSVWTPIPVLSEPIKFTAGSRGGPAAAPGKGKGKEKEKEKGKGKGKGNDKVDKQDRIRRTFVFPSPGVDGPMELTLTEQTSFDLDKKIWDSGLACSAFLSDRLRTDTSSFAPRRFSAEGEGHLCPVLDLLRSSNEKPLRILELGTGSGLVSIALASLLDQTDAGDKHQLYATDLPSAMPLVEINLASNRSLFETQSDVRGLALDWESPSLPSWVYDDASLPVDLVIMADVTYNVAIFPWLLRTVLSVLRPRPSVVQSRPTLVLLAWKERDPTGAEKDLWVMAEKEGLKFEMVGADEGHGGMPVEYWVGRLVE